MVGTTTEQRASAGYALVTGATSGIGQAVALRLAKQGVRVLGVGRNSDRAKATEDELVAIGPGHSVISGDLTSDLFLATLAERAKEWSAGELALLVLCAGHHDP